MHQFEADLLGRPRLNFDVLRLICNSLTEISDVLSFALTCSALAVLAFQRRLRMSPINLSNDELVGSFHRFIFADEPARAPYIHGLKLPGTRRLRREDTTGSRLRTMHDRLVAILDAAVHLDYLYFPTTVDLGQVLTAAANMTSLRELHMLFIGDCPWKLLSTFRSPLRSLHIEESEIDDGVTARLLHNHLANLAPTLEVLELEYYRDFDIAPSSVTTQFTAVRSLKIYAIVDFNQSTMEILLRLFPGLDGTLDLRLAYLQIAEDVYPSWREVNKEVQKTVAWSRLDRVVCNAQCAFLMALQCPIRRMDVTVPRYEGRRYLAPALGLNYPQRLHCTVSFRDSLDDLDELFPSTAGAANLTHLVMFAHFEMVDLGPEDKRDEVSWSRFKNKLIASIRHLRLTHLRLVVHYDVVQYSPERASANTAEEMDLHPAATKFAGAIPTLRCVFLTTCGHKTMYFPCPTSPSIELEEENKWLSSKAWRVVHDFGEPDSSNAESEASCTELSRSAAERISAQEELYLTHHWEHVADSLSRSIQHLRLTHLRIVFHSTVYQSSRTPPCHDGPFMVVRGVDLCPTAIRFVEAMLSLRYLFLTAYGRTVVVPAPKLKNQSAFDRRVTEVWHSSGACQVVHREEAPHPGGSSDAKVSSSCVELSHEAKERIMDQEDLRLSREEEDEMGWFAKSAASSS